MFAVAASGKCFAQNECQVTDWLPIGLENQGGYTFNYDSGKGQECRTYRLRNRPGQVETPVDWKDTRKEVEVLFNGNLAECPKAADCPWVERIKVSEDPSEKGATTLGYGVPDDEYQDTNAGAYRLKVEKRSGFPSFVTVLRGIIGGRKSKQHQIAIRVTSSVSGAAPFTLVYRLELAGDSEPLSTVPKSGTGTALSFEWQAAESPLFRDKLTEKQKQKNIQQLSSETPSLTVELSAKEVMLETSKTLVIYEGDVPIAATSAPAYHPKEVTRVIAGTPLAMVREAD